MSFSESVKVKALVACGRKCCICHKYCGNNMEVHHIKAKADGGSDDFANAIPLCFDCHAEVRQYDPKHPKGTRFTEEELIQHRDNWYKQIENGAEKEKKTDKQLFQPLKIYRQQGYQDIMLQQICTGKELLSLMQNVAAMEYDAPDPETREEAELLSDTMQEIHNLMELEFGYFSEPGDSIMMGFELKDRINTLEKQGFLLFGAKENRIMTGGIKNSQEPFPVALIRIVRLDDLEIIKQT